jgi:Ca-activated chloride channel family protein
LGKIRGKTLAEKEVIFLQSIHLSQILLITDGCSNVGLSPVDAAKMAKEEGHTVNVIGVVDQGEIGEYGSKEIREIASAGGGMSRIVQSKQLPQTVQMMTRQAMTRTIHQAVNRELRQILGGKGLEQLPPRERGQVVEAIDEWSETSHIKIVILIDTSLSMKPKLQSVEDAIRDLSTSLQARTGSSALSVMIFPGNQHTVEIKLDWTNQPTTLKSLFRQIKTKGTTPTGPALLEAIQFIEQCPFSSKEQPRLQGKEGLLAEYVF